MQSIDGTTAVEISSAGAQPGNSSPIQSISVGGVVLPLQAGGINLTVAGVEIHMTTVASTVSSTVGGAVSFTRAATFPGGHTAILRESFTPAECGAVEWALEINGTSPTLQLHCGRRR